MSLNCRPGDLAVIVKTRSNHHLLGLPVTCVSFAGLVAWTRNGGPEYVPTWHVERPLGRNDLPSIYQHYDFLIADDLLRPIRDPGDDATDETLLWKDVPHKETA